MRAGTEDELLTVFQMLKGHCFLDFSFSSDKPLIYEGGGLPWCPGQPEGSSRSLQVQGPYIKPPQQSVRGQRSGSNSLSSSMQVQNLLQNCVLPGLKWLVLALHTTIGLSALLGLPLSRYMLQ